MTQVERKQMECVVCCISCGHSGYKFVTLQDNGVPYAMTKCPKCSNKAYTATLSGIMHFMSGASREIARLKMEISDLQDDGEER